MNKEPPLSTEDREWLVKWLASECEKIGDIRHSMRCRRILQALGQDAEMSLYETRVRSRLCRLGGAE